VLRRLPLTLIATLVLSDGCVEVTDLRDVSEPPPTGQVDTGWIADTFQPDLPPPVACSSDADCEKWLGDQDCLRARCGESRTTAGPSALCRAEPVEDGTPCSDGDFRTHGDACLGGLCEPGPAVCVCQADDDCGAFDDGNQCNGRLTCDGCACVPIETPPGTPCDDLNPQTIDDVCVNESVCAGTIPCQCTEPIDCGDLQCREYVCSDCQCMVFAAVVGLLYGQELFTDGIPATWTATTDNPEIEWRADIAGGLRATGPDGIYDHGATVTTLLSPALALPPGRAVLRAEVGLLSAESGCDDRLEIYANDTLLETLCGPSAVSEHTWPIPVDQKVALKAVFISDGDDNEAAGAILDNVRWIRIEPSECGPPPSNPPEAALPQTTAGSQSAPSVTALDDGTSRAMWTAKDGLWLRAFDIEGNPTGPDVQVDKLGANPHLAGAWATWERGDKVVVQSPGATVELDDPEPASRPRIGADGAGVVYLVETAEGPVVRGRLAPLTVAVDLSGPDPAVHRADVAVHEAVPWVLVAGSAGVSLIGPGDPAEPQPLSDTPSTSPPALASGHNRLVSVWTAGTGLSVRGGAVDLEIPWPEPLSPAITPTDTGWIVLWVSGGGSDTGVDGALLQPDAGESQQIPTIAYYTFDDQDQIQVAPLASQGLAVWRSDWFDGDPSGVVFRRIKPPGT